MNILVTGGAGFIGSHLVDRLLAEGERVISLDDFNDYYDPKVKRRNIVPHLEHANYKLVEGDIRNRELVEEIFSREDVHQVVHLAARAGVRSSLREPLLYAEVNVEGTVNLLESACRCKVKRFIFGSSSSVYGVRNKIPFCEDDLVDRPISPYAASKQAGELYCYTYHHLYDLPVAALRFFTVYGPRQRPEMAIHKFTRLIDEGKEIPVFGNGMTKRDYTYISDIIDGIVQTLKVDLQYEIFNLGDSRTVELQQLISLLEQNLGKKARIKRLPDQPGDVPLTCADISKSHRMLNYSPSVAIEKGIARFIQWYCAMVKS